MKQMKQTRKFYEFGPCDDNSDYDDGTDDSCASEDYDSEPSRS